jgi:hypothetical protein
MFAIALVHRSGGSKTILGHSLKDCRNKAARTISKDYIAGTIPFAVYISPGSSNIYECSIPTEILETLGVEIRLLLRSEDE